MKNQKKFRRIRLNIIRTSRQIWIYDRKKKERNTGDLSFCAPFKTDTGYVEESRALIFFPYICILHKYIIFYTCSAQDMMERSFLSQVFVCLSSVRYFLNLIPDVSLATSISESIQIVRKYYLLFFAYFSLTARKRFIYKVYVEATRLYSRELT